MSISVYIEPQPESWPSRGGVREHLRQLFNHLNMHPGIHLVSRASAADIIHAESSYLPPEPPHVYVCHGGFVPNPIASVVRNLVSSQVIVSVADWIAVQYFPHFLHKTVTIPNGVRLDEWDHLPPSGLEPGYVLYAKEWSYYPSDVVEAAMRLPNVRFVSLVKPDGMVTPSNMEIIGLQDRDVIRSVINDAGCLLLPGPEVCPTMLLEAWACEVPVVARDGSGSREVMGIGDEPRGGYLYNNVDELVSHLSKLMSNVDNEHELQGGVGRMRAVREYQWVELVGLYANLYEAIVKHKVSRLFEIWNETRQRQAITRWQAGAR